MPYLCIPYEFKNTARKRYLEYVDTEFNTLLFCVKEWSSTVRVHKPLPTFPCLITGHSSRDAFIVNSNNCRGNVIWSGDGGNSEWLQVSYDCLLLTLSVSCEEYLNVYTYWHDFSQTYSWLSVYHSLIDERLYM